MYNCEVCKYAEWDWSEEPCIEGCSLGYEVFSNEECEGREKDEYEDIYLCGGNFAFVF